MGSTKAIFSSRPLCAAVSRDMTSHDAAYTVNHLYAEFCVFYCDKDIKNNTNVATNVAFQFNEKEIVIAIL